MNEARSRPALTVARPSTVSGVGLFSGQASRLTIEPAREPGVWFRRDDLRGRPRIQASVGNLAKGSGRNTAIADLAAGGSAGVATIEHVMSALAGLGIGAGELGLDGPEVPILDGSSEPFARLIMDVGPAACAWTIEPLAVEREVVVESGGGRITARPAASAVYEYRLDYGPGAWIPASAARIELDPDAYASRVAPARTFCLKTEADAMRAAGLFAHLTPRDMLVIGPGGPIENAYRFADEPARHKLLDLIGDLALVGRPILGEIVSECGGHALNHELARRLAGAAGGA